MSVVALLCVSANAGAQSFGAEALSPRVVADYIYAPPAPGVVPADPSAPHPLVAVVLWRGQAGWQSDSVRARRAPGPARGSAMSVGAGSTSEHSESVGGHDLAFRYDARARTVEVLGRSFDASAPVAILVDRADGAGGPSRVVGVVRLSNPFELPARWSDTPGRRRMPRGVLLSQALRQYPEVEKFLR